MYLRLRPATAWDEGTGGAPRALEWQPAGDLGTKARWIYCVHPVRGSSGGGGGEGGQGEGSSGEEALTVEGQPQLQLQEPGSTSPRPSAQADSDAGSGGGGSVRPSSEGRGSDGAFSKTSVITGANGSKE